MDAFANNADGYTKLEASSLAVGLPEGLMGNSEVGHLNIGAGRVVWQDVVRIDQTIKKGELNKNEVVMKAFNAAKDGNGRLHLCGLISDGGVVGTPLVRSMGKYSTYSCNNSTLSKITYTPSSKSQRNSKFHMFTFTSLVMDVTLTQNPVLVTWRPFLRRSRRLESVRLRQW